ncbi:MAG: hydantoinase/oxoprolinase family protein [Desulfurococcales archaeon]|nr:hydantoinase/oxoprolinase family protein [Desulfurococcales archaeon]
MLKVGVDVGGTFTDFTVFNMQTGRIWNLKVLTTPRNPVKGVINVIGRGLEGSLNEVSVLVHATTLGTNMFLGQTGLEPPPAVLVTNEGFIDVIEIGRQNRPQLYNPYYTRPKPLIPRSRRIGVKGRISLGGEELEPLGKEELSRKVKAFCGEGIKVYAISFLHSYKNPLHEEEAKKTIMKSCPGAIAVASHEVDPQPMEYERTSTTVVNALLIPLIGEYVSRLEQSLKERGFQGSILLMQSNGGVSSAEAGSRTPAAFIESGPSAGAIAVAYFSRLLGTGKSLGFDMGGTSAKASSVIDYEAEVTSIYEIGGEVHMGRRVRGSGYPIRFPYIDLAEVSAGGGTIAWVDPGGGLRVGPRSAGADPGPACYARGGKEPTITDANLVLGRLPEVLAGGGLRLEGDLAFEAVARIAEEIGVDTVEAAWSIVKISNTIMSKALRLVSVERGHDLREFAMYAFGGAGPLHAVEIARDLGVPRVIIPPFPGVFSALGLLVTDYRHSFTKPIVKLASEVTDVMLGALYSEMMEDANRILGTEKIPEDGRVMVMVVEAKYWGQGYTLQVPYTGSVQGTVEAFHELHEKRYGFSSREEPVEFVVARLDAVGRVGNPEFKVEKKSNNGEAKPISIRNVFFERGWIRSLVYSVDNLNPGDIINGPAVIEAPDSTILLPPGTEAFFHDTGALIVDLR